MGSEVGTGGQPKKAGEERTSGQTGLARTLALTPAATIALRSALDDFREEGTDGVTILGRGAAMEGRGREGTDSPEMIREDGGEGGQGSDGERRWR